MVKSSLDKVYDWMVKLGCINEADFVEVRRSLNESQESKSIDAAKSLVMQKFGWDRERADQFVRVELRQDIPALRDKNGGKFILGVTRMYCDGQLNNARVIQNINNVLKYVASPTHINEYDRNLNGITAKELIEKFAGNVQRDFDKDKEDVSGQSYKENSSYTIVPINSFEDASKYGQYTSWCVTHHSNMFESYTNGGYGQFYFCLKNGFENVPAEKGENCPLDEYGLSMIAVCVSEKGELSTCTCRWNHDNGGNDNIMDTKQISQLIGRNFYEVFKPNNKAAQAIEEVERFLKRTNDIDKRAWSCYRLDGLEDIAFITVTQNSRPFLVNTKLKIVLGGGELFKGIKQVIDTNYKRWPLVIVRKMNENYNILNPINNQMIFDDDVWYIEECFSCNGELYGLIEVEDGKYQLYNLSEEEFMMDIPGTMDNREGDEPFCKMDNILFSFYDDATAQSYFLLNDVTLHTEEDILENYEEWLCDNDGYEYDGDNEW